jgi:hypothetical protein
MQLKQMNVGYDRAQDRILLRLSTDQDTEYRMWLTRRMLIGMWPGVVGLVQNTPMARQQSDPEARKAVVEFQREQALRQATFDAPYEGDRLTPAIPGEPFLIWGVQMRPAQGGGHDINFLPKEGQGVHVRLQDSMLHAFVKLLQDVVKVTEWGVALELPAATAGAAPAGEASAGERKLN